MNLTKTQHRCYLAIRDFIQIRGHSPTYAEIGQMIGVSSTSTVHAKVKILVAKGYLMTNEHGRSMDLVPAKMHNLNNCFKGHVTIWFFADNCPLCEVLQRRNDVRE
jgi:SOS-response transcriptional repressor LexA